MESTLNKYRKDNREQIKQHMKEVFEKQRLEREKQKEEARIKQREYRAEHREELLEKRKAYYQKKKEEINQKQIEYKAENKEKLQAQQKQYREEHAEELKQKRNEKNTCDCGATFVRSFKKRHEATKKHQNFINK